MADNSHLFIIYMFKNVSVFINDLAWFQYACCTSVWIQKYTYAKSLSIDSRDSSINKSGNGVF